MLRSMPYLLMVALWMYALIDCVGTPPAQVRGLPKLAWLVIVILLGEVLVGPLAWLFLGKRRYAARGGATPSQWHRSYRLETVGEPVPAMEWVAPDDNPEFLRALAERIEKRKRQGGDEGTPPETV